MNVVETAHVFHCHGEELVAILHRPEECSATGFVAVPAGSVQYRAGSGRQLVHLARALAEQGYPVLRFDYRGMGDSSGEYRGFRHISDDLASAISLFREQLPELDQVVLYGACEAATGIMIHAGKIPSVGGVIIANPWVGDEGIKAAAMRTHYLKRVGQKEFWQKLLHGKYDISSYVIAALQSLRRKIIPRTSSPVKQSVAGPRPFQLDMLDGLGYIDCPILFLMSGGSLLKQEFEELVRGSTAWQKAISRENCSRTDLPEADQTFSTGKSKSALADAILDWVKSR